jgi:RNA polymerase sigma-70 factor (ECF subfamily)
MPEIETQGPEEASARRLDLREQLAMLDERDRELLALRFGADLTASQIAGLLDLKTNAVEVALHRALARLRERVQSPPADEPPAITPVRV